MKLDACNEAQRAAILLWGRDLLVTAGAGTGKTTVLVERVLQHLREGRVASLGELLVVTFTDKAAREMRERIYHALREEAPLRRFLPELPRAPISTIHAFCARFLREHCLEAELEPGFRVLDENGSGQAMEDALGEVLHRWYVKPDAGEGREFQSLVEMAGFDASGEQLRRVIRRLYAYARTTEDPEAYLAALRDRPRAAELAELPWWDHLVARAWGAGAVPIDRRSASLPEEGCWQRGVRLYEAAIDLARAAGKKTTGADALLAVLRSVTPAELATTEGRETMRGALAAAGLEGNAGLPLSFGFPRAPSGTANVPGFKVLHDGARASLGRDPLLSLAQRDPESLLREDAEQRRSLVVLVDLVRDLDAAYGAFKRRHALLDFSDLELHTARVLRAGGEAYRGLYREVLVDEFQDVNGLQNDILDRLATPEGRFRVGDVKQSIYQFRLADPTIFLRLQRDRTVVRRMEDLPSQSGPLCVLLAENHRSRPAVLRFANLIVAPLLGPAEIGTPYDEQALIPGRDADPAAPPVELHLIRPAGGEEKIAPSEAQAGWIVTRLDELIRNERPLLPRREGPDTPATWRDVAVLLRRRANASTFLEALQGAGIPAYLGRGGSLLEDEAVRDFRCLLQVIDNPRDDIALAAVLRSPLFGLTDSDLLRVRLAWPQAHSFLDAVAAAAGVAGEESPRPEASRSDAGMFQPPGLATELCGPPAGDASTLVPRALASRLRSVLDRVRAWRQRQGWMELTRFLEAVRAETGFETLLRAAGNGTAHAAALAKFLDLARACEEERGPSLHGFLARIEALDRAGSVDAVPVSSEEDDAVAVLTMHHAKGLEFPIVVIPELEWPGNRDALGSRIRLGREWAGVRHLDREAWVRRDSAARRVLERMQNEAERAEEARILYVALTRARERLILVGTPASADALDDLRGCPRGEEVIRERIRRARSALGWIMAALSTPGIAPQDIPLTIAEHEIGPEEIPEPTERGTGRDTGGTRTLSSFAARLGSPSEDATARLDALLRRVTTEPGHPPLARLEGLRGKYWVTELKSMADAERHRDLAEEGAAMAAAPRSEIAASEGEESGRSLDAESAARRGVAYHAALARFDLSATDPTGIDRQFAAFAQTPWWGEAGRDPALERGLVRFFQSDLGGRMRAVSRAGGRIEREVPFSLRVPVTGLLPLLPAVRHAVEADPRWLEGSWSRALDEAWAVVQGRIDCVFEEKGVWHLLDWKTDRGSAAVLAERARGYAWQMRIYEDAVRRLWGKPGETWLAFIAAGMALPVEAAA